MQMTLRYRALLGLLCAGWTALAAAQNPMAVWPNGPLRIVVPAVAGSPSDLVARLIGQQLSVRSGQPVVVDNKPGANGMLGLREVARARPDGRTIVIGYDAIFTINPFVYTRVGFDPREHFAPLALLGSTSQMLVCGARAGITTMAQLMEAGKQANVLFGSGGFGSPGHLALALLSDATGLRSTHVPYKGPSAVVTALLGGEIPCGFLTGPTVLPYVRSGSLKALALSSSRRSPLAPDVRPLGEVLNLSGFEANSYSMVLAINGTPPSTQSAIEAAVLEVAAQPAVREQLAAIDVVPLVTNAEQARQTLRAASEHWAPIVRRLELKPE